MKPTEIQELAGDMLEYLQCSSVTTQQALSKAAEAANEKQAAATLKPEVLQFMQDRHIVSKDEVKQASDLLGSHHGTLQLLKLACEQLHNYQTQLSETKAASLGGPAAAPAGRPSTTVVRGSLQSPECGVKTAGLKDSDRELFKIFDDPTPGR